MTAARVIRAILACMQGGIPDTSEIDGCQKCRILFAITMSNAAALMALRIDSGARMFYELQLSAIEAAIERGETETPPDGFI